MPDVDYLQVYIDDFVIFWHKLDDHVDLIISGVRIIAFYGVKLKISKCHFDLSRIGLLGHIISIQDI